MLFSAVPGDEAVGILKCRKFHLNLRNAFSTGKVMKGRSRLSERLWSLHLGDLQNPVAGHSMCSEQGAGLGDVQRCLPASALLWRIKYRSLEWMRYKTSQFLQSVKNTCFSSNVTVSSKSCLLHL